MADRQGKSLAAAAGMTAGELSLWAAFYGSSHDPAAAAERRLMRKLEWLSYFVMAAGGADVKPEMFVSDYDPDGSQTPADGPGAEAAFDGMMRRKGYEVI